MFEIFYKTLYGIFYIYVHKHKPNKNVNNYPNHIVKLKLKCFKLFKKRLNSHNNFIAWNCTTNSLYEQTKHIRNVRNHYEKVL